MTRERLWPLALFLVLVLPLSWYGFLIRGSSAADSGLNPLGPLVAALIASAASRQFRDYVKRIFRVRAAPSTYAIALGLPVLLCLTAVATGALATGTAFPAQQAALVRRELLAVRVLRPGEARRDSARRDAAHAHGGADGEEQQDGKVVLEHWSPRSMGGQRY